MHPKKLAESRYLADRIKLLDLHLTLTWINKEGQSLRDEDVWNVFLCLFELKTLIIKKKFRTPLVKLVVHSYTFAFCCDTYLRKCDVAILLLLAGVAEHNSRELLTTKIKEACFVMGCGKNARMEGVKMDIDKIASAAQPIIEGYSKTRAAKTYKKALGGMATKESTIGAYEAILLHLPQNFRMWRMLAHYNLNY